MNIKQIMTLLKAVLVGIGPSLLEITALLGYETSTVEKVIAAAVSITGLILLVLERTDRALVVDTKDIKGVQIHVDPLTAPKPVVAASLDPKVNDVLPMVGGPRTD
jgi:hypothetical protein